MTLGNRYGYTDEVKKAYLEGEKLAVQIEIKFKEIGSEPSDIVESKELLFDLKELRKKVVTSKHGDTYSKEILYDEADISSITLYEYYVFNVGTNDILFFENAGVTYSVPDYFITKAVKPLLVNEITSKSIITEQESYKSRNSFLCFNKADQYFYLFNYNAASKKYDVHKIQAYNYRNDRLPSKVKRGGIKVLAFLGDLVLFPIEAVSVGVWALAGAPH